MQEPETEELWPEEKKSTLAPGLQDRAEPDAQLAVYLLAAGATTHYVRSQCGFATLRDVQTFAKDDNTRQAIEELGKERVSRVGKKALVKLEKLLGEEHSDLRATVLAIRTGLEVAGDLKRDHSAPLKSVRELSVGELNTLIESTKRELDARIPKVGRQRVGKKEEAEAIQ